MFNLIDDPRYDNLTVSTDTRTTARGIARATGKWAVYVNGRKLHGDLRSPMEAAEVCALYAGHVSAADPRWEWYGGKQPSPRTDDMRKAREDNIMYESGCTRAEASERVQYEHAHNLLDRHEIAKV